MNDINLYKVKDSLYLKQVTSKTQVSLDDDCDGYLLSTSEKECRRIIDSLRNSGKVIAVMGSDNAFNRRALETLNIDYLINPERVEKRDTLKQRDSGLNHVLAKIAAKKNITIVFSVSDFSSLDLKARARRLSRIIQNIKICRKVNCPIKIVSLATSKKHVVSAAARQALGMSLGMSSQQARDASLIV